MRGFSIKQAYKELKEAKKTPIELLCESVFVRLPYLQKLHLYFVDRFGSQRKVTLNLNKKGFPNSLGFIVETVERFKLNQNVIKALYLTVDNENIEVKSVVYHYLKDQYKSIFNTKQYQTF